MGTTPGFQYATTLGKIGFDPYKPCPPLFPSSSLLTPLLFYILPFLVLLPPIAFAILSSSPFAVEVIHADKLIDTSGM